MVILMNLDIRKNQYLMNLDKTKPVICAVSGGVDSMVLFDLLKKAQFEVIIVHVNHHKREESATEEAFLRTFAEKNHCKIYVYDYYHEQNNFQASARRSRYDFFYQIYQENKASAIITAHHADDNLETIIINLIKGSNLYGYSGISGMTYYKEALLIRPLIDVKKENIYSYAKENNLIYFEDLSNQSDDYLRNRIRHHITPIFKEENPSYERNIYNYSKQVLDAFNYIRKQTSSYWQKNQKIILNDFHKMDSILQSDLINYLFEEKNITSSTNKITDVIEVLTNNKPNITYDLNDDFQLIKTYEEAFIIKRKSPLQFNITLEKDGITKTPKGRFYLSETPLIKSFKISLNEEFPLTIRTRLNGDILNIRDGHKKLKDFCIDKKIPLEKRNELVIITNRLGEIIWVVDYYQKKYCDEKQIYLNYEESKDE